MYTTPLCNQFAIHWKQALLYVVVETDSFWLIFTDFLCIHFSLCLAPFKLPLPHMHSIIHIAVRVFVNLIEYKAARNPKYDENDTDALKNWQIFSDNNNLWF